MSMNVTANLKNWAASKGAAAAIWVNDTQLCSVPGSGKEEVGEVPPSPRSVQPGRERCLSALGQGGPGTPQSCLGPSLITRFIRSRWGQRSLLIYIWSLQGIEVPKRKHIHRLGRTLLLSCPSMVAAWAWGGGSLLLVRPR